MFAIKSGERMPEGVLLLDKPAGFSSTRALAKAKRLLGAAKAGHTGTLDPFATGLLPLVFGEATKFSRFLLDARKAYLATLRLGVETSTGDPEGAVVGRSDWLPDLAQIDRVLGSFVGVQAQLPPMHSAVHVGGRRLYEYAREGLEVPRASRSIEIEALERRSLVGCDLTLSVVCSKGTYVRALACDIGRALGCGAHLVALRRTAVGDLGLDQAHTLETLEADGREASRERLLPLDVLVAGLTRCEPGVEEATRFTQGQAIGCGAQAEGIELALFAPGGRFLGVGRSDGAGRVAPLRVRSVGESSKPPDFA